MKKLYIALLFTISAITGNAQNAWTGLTGPSGGPITDIQNDGATIFAIAPGPSGQYTNIIYKSTNDGSTWVPFSPLTLPVYGMLVETNKVYAIEWAGSLTYYLNVSTNGGVTWTRKNTTSIFKAESIYRRITPTPGDDDELIAWSSVNGDAYISTDDGVTWTSFYTRATSETIFSVVSNSAGDVFLSSSLGVFRHPHPSAGQWLSSSFTNVYNPLVSNVYNLSVGIDALNNLYLIQNSYNGSNINKLLGSNTNGSSWIDLMPASGLSASHDFYQSKFFISSNGVFLSSINYAISNVQKIYKSLGFNSSLTEFTTSPGATYSNTVVSAFKFVSSTKIFAGTSGNGSAGGDGVFKSTDTGATWSLATNGINALEGRDIKITSTGRILYLVNSGLGYWYSDNQGVNWSFKQISNIYSMNEIIVSGTTLIAYGVFSNVYRSVDNGDNWNTTLPTTDPSTPYLNGLVAKGAELYASASDFNGTNKSIFKSIDYGTSWTPLTAITGLPVNATFGGNTQPGLAINANTKFVVPVKNTITNKWEMYEVALTGGAATKLSSFDPTTTSFRLNGFFAVGSKIYWADDTNIYISTDNGATWKTLTFSNQKIMPVITYGTPNRTGIGVGRPGVFFTSTDDGLTWNSFSTPNAGSVVRAVATNASNVSFAAATVSPALKYVNPLVVDPATIPPYVNFNWTPTGGPYGGDIRKVFVGNSGKYFALASNYLYSTTNITNSPTPSTAWTKVVDPNFYYSFQDIAVDNTGKFYATDGYRFFTSVNEGQTWTLIGTGIGFFNGANSVRVSNGTLVVGASNTVYKSTDGGLNWSTIYNSTTHYGYGPRVAASEASNTIFVVDSNSGIMRSVAGGAFTSANTGLANPTSSQYYITTDPSGRPIAWSYTDIYRSADNGDSWVSIKNSLSINTVYNVVCKSATEYFLFAPGTTGVIRTTDGGVTWTKVSNGLTANTFLNGATFSGGVIYTAAANDGVQYSTNDGTTWTEWTTGINQLNPYNIRMINNQRLFFTASGSTSTSYVSLDKGTTWSKSTPTLSKIFPMPDGSYLASGASSINIYKSTDGGATWPTFTTTNSMTDISTADGNTLYGVSNTSIYTKTSSGSWTQLTVTGLPSSYSPLQTIAVDADSKAYIILNNAANNYKPELYQIAFGSAYKMNFTANPVNIQFYKGVTYAYDGGGTVYSTTDGVTWTSKATPSGTKFIISHLDYFFILDNSGVVWLSRDLGSTWQNVGDNMPQGQKFVDVFFNPNDGVVYGAVQSGYQRKSTIILPAETVAPTITTFSPLKNAVNLLPTPTFNLQITFSETVNPVAGKKIKIHDATNTITPLGSLDVTLGTMNGNIFTFNPSAFTPAVTFGFSKSYFVVIEPGAFVDVNNTPNLYAGLLNTTAPNAWTFGTKLDDGQAPVITTRSPVDDATNVAYASPIQFTFDENIFAGSGKTIRLYESPSTLVQTFDATTGIITGGKIVTFTPSNPLGNGKSYYVQMDVGAFTDLFGNPSAAISTTTGWNFNSIFIDIQPPVVSTYSPANNATGVGLSPPLQLTFSEDIQIVVSKALRIYDSSAPSTPVETINVSSGTITGGKTVTFTPTASLSGSKTYYVLVDAGAFTDLAGNSFAGISSNIVWKFSTVLVDSQAPLLTQVAPTNNATNVAIGTTLTLTFDENIQTGTGKKIKLFDSADPVTPIENIDASAGTVSAKSVTFTLTKSLTGSKTYYVLLDNGAITDLTGNAYAGISTNTTWKFSTDAIAPSVAQFTPTNNSTDVAFTTTLALGFSEAVVAVNGKAINVFVANTTTPVATLDASAGVISGNTVTFTLANPLVSNTAYYVLVTNGAFTDLSGNPYAGITAVTEWTFTARDGSPPVITLLEPADDATEVSLTSKLKITFDEAITKVLGKKLIVYESSQPTSPLKTIDISTSTLTGKTLSFDPGNIFAYNKSYFVLVENGAVIDAQANEFSGIAVNTQWQFSVETDTQKPVITYTDAGSLIRGSSTYLIAATISDNKVVSAAKVFYRGISSESTGAFTSAALALNSSTTKYEFSVPEAAFDKYGLEFYLEGADAAGNSTRSPAVANAFHYAYVKFSAASAPSLPGLSFGGTLASYRIIAVPYNLTDNKVATIFGELGSANKSKWRLLTYLSDTKWNDYPTDFTTIERGVGYWINVKTATEIFIEGASMEGTNKNALFSKTFNPGWNQIGNPYPVAISWNTIKAATPAAAALGVVKTYKDGFQNGDILQPLEGGFVFNSGASVTISIPLPASSGGRQGNFIETQLDRPNWALDINMKQGDIKYELAGVGMHPKAQLEFDSFDDVNPPHFAEFAEIHFAHPQERFKKFSRDIVPTQDSFTWEFNVDTNLPDEGELYWDNTGFGVNSKELYLYDVAMQKPIDMRKESRYVFDSKTSFRFKLFYGNNLNKEVKPESVSLGTAYPNPAQSQTTISFTLPENGSMFRVSLDVFDAMGKKVGTLLQGDFASGFYTAVWDLSGGQTAKGIYHVRLEAKGSRGVEIRSTKVLIEK